jgi:hypothetical protein
MLGNAMTPYHPRKLEATHPSISLMSRTAFPSATHCLRSPLDRLFDQGTL